MWVGAIRWEEEDAEDERMITVGSVQSARSMAQNNYDLQVNRLKAHTQAMRAGGCTQGLHVVAAATADHVVVGLQSMEPTRRNTRQPAANRLLAKSGCGLR